MKVSVFIPCYNEEHRLSVHLKKIQDALEEITHSYELILVDDNSSDRTGALGKEIAKKNRHVVYIRFNKGPSRRENLAHAFSYAKANIILFMDLDLSADLKDLRTLMGYIEQGYDIAFGSRYKGVAADREASRLVISKVYNTLISFFFRSTINDHQCGFKAFNKRKLFPLLQEMGYDKTFVRGWFWDAELLIRAQRHGYALKEFPVEWKEGKTSSFNFSRELRMIPYVVKLWWKLR